MFAEIRRRAVVVLWFARKPEWLSCKIGWTPNDLKVDFLGVSTTVGAVFFRDNFILLKVERANWFRFYMIAPVTPWLSIFYSIFRARINYNKNFCYTANSNPQECAPMLTISKQLVYFQTIIPIYFYSTPPIRLSEMGMAGVLNVDFFIQEMQR